MSAFQGLGQRRGGRRGISLTPLIDVVFILLLFFMLTSTFNRYHSVELDALSVAQSPAAPAIEAPLLITVLGGGHYRLGSDDASMAAAALVRRVSEASNGQRALLVRAGQALSVQQLIGGIEELQGHGLSSLSLVPSASGGGSDAL